MSGVLDEEGCQAQLATLMTSDVSYMSTYTPSNEEMQPFFEARNGIDDMIALFDFEKANGVHAERIDDWELDGNAIAYTRTTTGSLLQDGPVVTWQHVYRVTFDTDGKIKAIDYTIVDPEPIETAYP